jgi:hypothetical protein
MFLPKYSIASDEKIKMDECRWTTNASQSINDLKKLAPYNTTLFKINGAKSPYFKSKIYIRQI